MLSLNSLSIFKTKITKLTPIDNLIPMLSELRLKMNFNFYYQLIDEEKEKVLAFLFNTLHTIWYDGPTEIKIPAAYTVGHLLVNFGPFLYEDLMKFFITTVKNYNSTSILYFSCFCYLSKFYSPKEIESYTQDINILDLISINDAGYLPKMTKELFGLPNQMLHSLAERYISFLKEDPDNGNILQSAQIIISQNPDMYSDLIKEDMPFEIITTIFNDNIPILNANLVQSLSNSALQAIQDYCTPLKKFSAACKLLSSFISRNQLPATIVQGIFTTETITKAVSLEDLLLLPIEPSLVFSIYGNQNTKTNLLNSGTINCSPDDSQISLFANSNPNISNVFGTNDFNSNDQDEISLIFDDGSVQVSIPGAPMESISFLPSLPLPDYPDISDETKSVHNHVQVTFGQAATKFEHDSPNDINIFLKSNSFSDLANVPPPPSIPSILGGSESPLQPSSASDNINPINSSPKKACFASPPLSERPSKHPTQRLSLDLNSPSTPNSNNSYISTKNGRNQIQKSTLQLRLNPKFVVPLINYFKRYPEFKNEFYNLVLYSISLYKTKTLLRFNSLQSIDRFESGGNLSSKADAVYSALKAVSETHSKFQSTELNNILEKIFEIPENSNSNNKENEDTKKNRRKSLCIDNNNKVDITLQLKILELIGTLNADRLTKKVANKMFNFIETASISKFDILRKKAKKSFTSLTDHTSTDLFKFFFDIYIQKLDLFNLDEFSFRLSFISYVMTHLPNQTHVSFCSIATLLYEALLLNGSFHRNVMLNMFQILSVLAPSISNTQILIVFIQHAMNIIKKNYTDYTGIKPFSLDGKYPFFNNHYHVENTLVQLDTDLISNPSVWHRKYLKCSRIAYSFLATIPWDKFEMTNNDKRLVEIVIWHMSMLLPKETSTFLLLLRDSKLISPKSSHKTIINLNKISRRKEDVIAFLPLYRFVCKKNEKYKVMNTDSITDSLTNFLPRLNDITNDQAISIKLFFAEKQIDASDEMKRFEKVLNSSVISTSSSEISHLDLVNKNENENDEEDENENETVDAMMNDQELSSFIISLTPLVYANLDVPPEFLQPFQIQSFCNNSTSAIDEDQCNQLFEYALSNSSPRVICCVIRYALRMHYKINIEDHLSNPIFNSKKLFSCVFTFITKRKKGFQNLSSKCNQYIKQFYPNGFFSYVLNATELQRSNAIKLMQFDPNYFMNQYLQIEKFTTKQLINICIYIQNVKFPKDSLFRFVIGLLSQSAKNQSQTNIVRRILSVFVSCYGSSNKRAAKQIYDIIACELGFPSPLNINSPHISKLSAANLLEFGYSLISIASHVDCEKLLNQIADIFTKSVPSYYYVISSNSKKGTISLMADCLDRILPSIRHLNVMFACKYLRNNSDFNVNSDFINNVAKLFDLFVPLPIHNSNNNRITNDDSANCYFCFAMCALSHELNSSAQKTLYNLSFDRMPFELSSYSIGRFNSVFKGFINQQHLRNDLLNDIFQRCCAISESVGSVRPFFIDLFSTVAKSVGKLKIFCDKMANVMVNKLSYDSPEVCENAATELMRNVSNLDEANNILPFEIPDFFIFFIAISSIEKKNRAMVHTKLQKRYKGTHLLALQMLKDPKFRIFAPLVALIEKDIDIPPKLKDYLDSISDKIQRVYSTDTYHEF